MCCNAVAKEERATASVLTYVHLHAAPLKPPEGIRITGAACIAGGSHAHGLPRRWPCPYACCRIALAVSTYNSQHTAHRPDGKRWMALGERPSQLSSFALGALGWPPRHRGTLLGSWPALRLLYSLILTETVHSLTLSLSPHSGVPPHPERPARAPWPDGDLNAMQIHPISCISICSVLF